MLERVTVILAAAWLLTLVLWRAPAAARHMVWTCAVAAALLTPVLSALPTRPVLLPAAFARWAPSAAVNIAGAPDLTANAPASVPAPARMRSASSQDAAATASRGRVVLRGHAGNDLPAGRDEAWLASVARGCDKIVADEVRSLAEAWWAGG